MKRERSTRPHLPNCCGDGDNPSWARPLDDDRHLRTLFRRHIETPLWLSVPLLVAVLIVADEGYHADLFPAHVSTVWFGACWLVLGLLALPLEGCQYVGQPPHVHPRSAAGP
jgi:hypothetical protein